MNTIMIYEPPAIPPLPSATCSVAEEQDWMNAALVALEQGQNLNTFVSHCHPDNRAQAIKGYKQMQAQIRYGCEQPNARRHIR